MVKNAQVLEGKYRPRRVQFKKNGEKEGARIYTISISKPIPIQAAEVSEFEYRTK